MILLAAMLARTDRPPGVHPLASHPNQRINALAGIRSLRQG